MKVSEQERLLEGVKLGLLGEQAAYIQKEKVLESEKYREAQAVLLESVRAIGQMNDPALILTAEKTILVNEKRNYGNSAGMISSLDAAILEMTTTEKMLDKVQNPENYKRTDEDHSLSRNRVKGVPRDEARKSLSSHLTRLQNMDKPRLTETEKLTIKARRSNLRKAEKTYTVLQHQALGIKPQDKSRELDRGR